MYISCFRAKPGFNADREVERRRLLHLLNQHQTSIIHLHNRTETRQQRRWLPVTEMAPSLWLFFAMLCAARGDERRFDQLFLSDDNNGSEYATGMYAGVRENSPYNNATADTMEERVEARVINIPGDFILGGLFPVHKRSVTSAPCGEIQAQRGIQVGTVVSRSSSL